MSGGIVIAMMVVFWLASSGERSEMKSQELRNKCYQLVEVEKLYESRSECVSDKARKG